MAVLYLSSVMSRLISSASSPAKRRSKAPRSSATILSEARHSTLYFGNDGATAYEAELTRETEGLTWRMRSKTTRFTGLFNEDGNVITGHWELLQDGRDWQPWMDITLIKQGD